MKYTKLLILAIFVTSILVYFNGCQNSIVEPTGDDDEYLKTTAITTLFDNSDDPDNIFANDIAALDDEGAVPDYDGAPSTVPTGGFSCPIDSIIRHGRKLDRSSLVTVATITSVGDSLKNVNIKKTINGVYIIIGYVQGVLDTIVKPISLEKERFAVFKRVANTPYPRRNWRLFQLSAADGQTTAPQVGESNILLNKIEIYRNGILLETLLGPDFTQNMFSSRIFSGAGIMNFRHGDAVRIKVFLNSNQQAPDLVALHWGKRYVGHYRERIPMISQTPNGSTFDRIFERTFNIGTQHRYGVFNSFISGTTFSSLFDTNVNLFSSTAAGAPYRMLP